MNGEIMILVVLLVPAAGALVNALLGGKFPAYSGVIATAAAGASLLAAIPLISAGVSGEGAALVLGPWISTPNIDISFTFRVNELSSVMLIVVLGVGTLIHLYSIEYMAEDDSRPRFFAYINMFLFFMLTLILADDLLVLFVGWEGVGLASYALIGFWYEREAPVRAGIKAFVTNRIGDVAFTLGILTLAAIFGTLDMGEIRLRLHSELLAIAADPSFPSILGTTVEIFSVRIPLLTLTGALLFIGACGKSAQFPLHVWLPDAMEGPTPVSALIHAATMVTAGVYMIARLNFIFAFSSVLESLILTIAVITALGAALAACGQRDLKRILAYSTISQLGYMMAGVAVGAIGAGVFHLFTHAFFKALLFLGAGAVMHAMNGELDIWRMGGLSRRIPMVAVTFVVGALALAGLFPLGGFFSKDLILLSVLDGHPLAFGLLLLGAGLTAYYSGKMILVVFFGRHRFESDLHIHMPGVVIIVPLVLLGFGTIISGFVPIPEIISGAGETGGHLVAILGTLATVIGLGTAYLLHGSSRIKEPENPPGLLGEGFYIDRIYDLFILEPLRSAARLTRDWIDRNLIDGIVNGAAEITSVVGEGMGSLQSGNLGRYLVYLVLGAFALLLVFGRIA